MYGLIAAGIASAAKIGYDQYKISQNNEEKRNFHDYVSEHNYRQYIRSLQESPSAQREGLERAGYNPLLALGNVGSSSFSGPSNSSGNIDPGGDIISSAKAGADLLNDVRRAYDDKHEESDAQTNLLNSEAEAKIVQAENDTLRTFSQLENDAVERSLKSSQDTKTKVDTVTGPISAVGHAAFGAASAMAAKKALAYAVKKNAPKIIPLISNASKVSTILNPVAAAPLLFGSAAAAGIKASAEGSGKKIVETGYDKTAGRFSYQHGAWSR